MDREGVISAKKIIAILPHRSPAARSRLVLSKGHYLSRTTAPKLAERLNRGLVK